MQRFARSFFLFIGVVVAVYIVVIFIWGTFLPLKPEANLFYPRGSYGHTYSRLQEVKTVKNIDLLFLGSSHTYRGFDNRLWSAENIKTFNLGSSSQTPIETKLLLSRYLGQLNPNVIIFEVYPQIFTSDGVESSLDIIANDKNDWHSVQMAIEINNVQTYNTLAYGFIHDLLRMDNSFSEAKQKDMDTYIPGGFVEKQMAYFKTKRYPQQQWKWNNKQFEAFNKILQIIKARNIKLLLVQAPVTSVYYNSFTNNNMFDSIMNTYGNYYNFNNRLPLNDSLNFYDTDHLNQTGIVIFNDSLIKLVKANSFQ